MRQNTLFVCLMSTQNGGWSWLVARNLCLTLDDNLQYSFAVYGSDTCLSQRTLKRSRFQLVVKVTFHRNRTRTLIWMSPPTAPSNLAQHQLKTRLMIIGELNFRNLPQKLNVVRSLVENQLFHILRSRRQGFMPQ